MRPSGPRDILAWMLGRRLRVRVAGPSMEPTLADGTTILVKPLGPGSRARPGDILLVRHPTDEQVQILKRVDHLTNDGRLFLRGDGSVSTDSRDFGPVPQEHVLGRVTCTLP